jgi:hypothetical protein
MKNIFWHNLCSETEIFCFLHLNDKNLDKWRQKKIIKMILNGALANAEREMTGALVFDSGIRWGGVPGSSEG